MQTHTDLATAPRYRLLGPCYLEDDTLHDEGEEIIYLGTPNEEMEPLNEAARQASTAFLEGLDDAARAVAAARKMPFLGRQALMEQAYEHAMAEAKRVVVLPAGRGEIPVRPDLATPAQKLMREQRQPRKVLGSKPPPVKRGEGRRGPAPVLGNVGQAAGEPVIGTTPVVE